MNFGVVLGHYRATYRAIYGYWGNIGLRIGLYMDIGVILW